MMAADVMESIQRICPTTTDVGKSSCECKLMNPKRWWLLMLTLAALGCASNNVALQQKCSGGDQAACEELARAQEASPPATMPTNNQSPSAPVIAPMIQMP